MDTELIQNRISGLSVRFFKVLEIMGLHRCRPVPATTRPPIYLNLNLKVWCKLCLLSKYTAPIMASNCLSWPQIASIGLKLPHLASNCLSWPQLALTVISWPEESLSFSPYTSISSVADLRPAVASRRLEASWGHTHLHKHPIQAFDARRNYNFLFIAWEIHMPFLLGIRHNAIWL